MTENSGTGMTAKFPGTLVIGKDGKDGGYYRVSVEQVDSETLRFSFAPSAEGMAVIQPVDVKLPTRTAEGGADGKSAYEVALDNGFEGTEEEWLESLIGPEGPQGEQGPQGEKGDTGDTGEAGADGKSAYAYAQEGGYTGTEAEFAAKLAEERFANPNALTINGTTYDGSEAMSVETRDLVFNVTANSQGDCTTDTTYAEIAAALDAGRTVVCKYTSETAGEVYLQLLLYVKEGVVAFAASQTSCSWISCILFIDNYMECKEVTSSITISDTTYDGSAAVDFTTTINTMIDAKLGVIENGAY